jgi:uncharacterized membrane protein YhaH (DUF805 family)
MTEGDNKDFEARGSQELLEILVLDEDGDWSDEDKEAIRQILNDRNVSFRLPRHKSKPDTESDSTSNSEPSPEPSSGPSPEATPKPSPQPASAPIAVSRPVLGAGPKRGMIVDEDLTGYCEAMGHPEIGMSHADVKTICDELGIAYTDSDVRVPDYLFAILKQKQLDEGYQNAILKFIESFAQPHQYEYIPEEYARLKERLNKVLAKSDMVLDENGKLVYLNKKMGDDTGEITMKNLLFSFKGRIKRGKYWGVSIALIVISLFLQLIETGIPPDAEVVMVIVSIPVWIFLVWVGIAISVKRLHDRGKSGWFYLFVLIPIIGAIWMFIELGCLEGTKGPNRFGPEPESGSNAQAAT